MTGSSDLDHADSLATGTIEAQESLESFPRELKVASLYLALSAQRSSFNLVVNDVYLFMKDRYFVGEVLQACLEGKSWSNCTILQVCEPSVKEVEDYNNITVANSSEEVKLFPPACLYKYRVQKFCSYNDINRVFEAGASHIRRKKRQLTKGKLRLFLKECLVLDSRRIWIIQEPMLQNLGINSLKFSDIFVGSPPKFPAKYEKVAKKAKKNSPKNFIDPSARVGTKKDGVKKAKINNKSPRRDKNNPVPAIDGIIDFNAFCRSTDAASSMTTCKVMCHKLPKNYDNPKIIKKVKKKYAKPEGEKENEGVRKKYATWRGMTWEERQKLKEKKEKIALLDKLKRREEKQKQKDKLKEEKILMAILKKKHNLLREDLECEDLKPLPVPHLVQCSDIPNELFGDFMLIVEFFHCFKTILNTKLCFSRAITYKSLVNILTDKRLNGKITNIVILLLSSLFEMKGEENETTEGDNGLLEIDDDLSDMPTSEAIRLAAAEYGSQLYHVAFANESTKSYLTVTELLRLHLTSCGGITGHPTTMRVSTVDSGDPVSILRKRHPRLLNDLCDLHISELPIAEKISILCCLVDQILSCPPVREELEKRGEELRLRKTEIRTIKSAELKRTKEAEAQRLKEKREAKLKLKEQENSGAIANSEIEEVKEDIELFDKDLRSTRRNIQEMYSELRSMAMMFNIAPIGYDRAHRRFWMFPSLPGLFVEHHPFEIGPCLLKPTPRESQSPRNDGKWQARKNSPHKSPNKKVSCTLSPSRKVILAPNNCGNVSTESWFCTSTVNCPVHGHAEPRSKWFYFHREEEITTLRENLNCRGIRENELRKVISRDEKWVKESIKKCPINFIDSSLCSENEQNTSSKNRNSIDSEELSNSATLELILRDKILDFESKMSSGFFGSLEVSDLNAWREAIANNEYDMQCDELSWGMCSDPKEESDSKSCDTDDGDKYGTDNVLRGVDVINGEFVMTQESLLSLHPSNTAQTKSKRLLNNRVLEEKNGQNIRSSPCRSQRKSQDNNSMEIGDPTTASDPPKVKYAVRSLSCAILQLEQSIDIRYFRKPLVENKDSDQDKLYELKRWETSLMTALSVSQLFLHMSILNSSIFWSMSVNNTRCVGCRKRSDADKMLLCDGCNQGTHIFCLRPKLTIIPDGDWFCQKCQQTLKKNQTNKKRSLNTESLNTQPTNKEYEKRPSKSRKIVHNDVCEACGLRYNLILCSSCPLAFHPICVVPPLEELPEGLWTCGECESQGAGEAEEKENEASSSRRSSRGKSGPDLSLNNSLLQDLLSDLQSHRDSWPFLHPVRKADVPRYHIIVKKPMDFGTMKYKLNRSHYKLNSEFIDDALLVFANCRMYNENDGEVYKCGAKLSEYFKNRCKDLGLHCRD